MPRSAQGATSPFAIGAVAQRELVLHGRDLDDPEASSICSTDAFETPTQRTLPSSRSSLSAPTDSAYGTCGSGRWNW